MGLYVLCRRLCRVGVGFDVVRAAVKVERLVGGKCDGWCIVEIKKGDPAVGCATFVLSDRGLLDR